MVLKEKRYEPIPLRMENMCEALGYYWFTSFHFNALYRMTKDDLEVEYVCSFPNEESKERMYSQVRFCDGKIYCIPLSADSIGVYDIATRKCESIDIEEPKYCGLVKYKKNSKFFDAFCDGRHLYIFPHTYPAIVTLQLSNGSLEYHYDELEKVCEKSIGSYYFARGVQLKDKIWLFNNANNTLCKFDMKKKRISLEHRFDFLGAGVIAGFGDTVWIFSHNKNCVYKYNINDGLYKIIKNSCKDFIPGSCSVTRTALFNDKIIFMPGTSNIPLFLDIYSDEIYVDKGLAPHVTELPDREVWKFSFVENFGNKLLTYDSTISRLLVVAANGEIIERRLLYLKYVDESEREVSGKYWFTKKKDARKLSDLRTLLEYSSS